MGNATVVSVVNWKGGVGKTTITHHLGTGLQCLDMHDKINLIGINENPRILLIDLDAQCSLSVSCLSDDIFDDLAFEKKIPTVKDLIEIFLTDENSKIDLSQYILKNAVLESKNETYASIDLIVSYPDLIYTDMNIAVYSRPDFQGNLMNSNIYKFEIINNILKRVKENYDFILIDCPPNLNFITQNALYASDFYLIPTIPDKLSSYGILSISKKVNDLNKTFAASSKTYRETELAGIIINKVHEYSQEPKKTQINTISALKKIFHDSIFKNYLTDGDGITQASSAGLPVFALREKNPNAEKQSKALIKIIKEFLIKIRR